MDGNYYFYFSTFVKKKISSTPPKIKAGKTLPKNNKKQKNTHFNTKILTFLNIIEKKIVFILPKKALLLFF